MIREDEGAALMALKIYWVSLLRQLRESTKMVFEEKLEEQLREEAKRECFPS